MLEIAAWVVIFLASVIIHEVCHGLVADLLGDPTAKQAGRLTLNPLKHIDPFWTVIFPGLLFLSTQGRFAIGMAKPVPVDFSRLRYPKRDMIYVAASGPLANFVLALLMNVLWKFFPNPVWLYGIYFNLGIGLFNLIPIPPLDGSRILMGLMPLSLMRPYAQIERYGFLIILALYMTGILFSWIIPVMNMLCRILDIPQLGISY
ncbi:MAG: site-2 protease family protein [Candidatus Omnitrophota bacterium]|nr:site-2 protease family protein [Candidatus Omnitrophota bacterium]